MSLPQSTPKERVEQTKRTPNTDRTGTGNETKETERNPKKQSYAEIVRGKSENEITTGNGNLIQLK